MKTTVAVYLSNGVADIWEKTEEKVQKWAKEIEGKEDACLKKIAGFKKSMEFFEGKYEDHRIWTKEQKEWEREKVKAFSDVLTKLQENDNRL